MKESGDGVNNDSYSKSLSVNSGPLVLDEDDFKGDFSFDALFGNLVNELLPSYHEEETDSLEGHGNIGANDVLSNGNLRIPPDAGKFAKLLSGPLFPEVDALLSLFQDSCRELIELHKKIDGRLSNLKKEVVVQDSKHRKTLTQLEKGVDGLFGSFARLDSRISSVGQTAAKIGDHLQSADAQRETASQTIELIKYLMEFNSSPGDLLEISPLFSDDSLVAEAASIAQKLRSFAEEDIGSQSIAAPSVAGNATASRGLEVAVANLQEYCNELENRLLSRFDVASQRRELSTMKDCAKILSQFNRGTSAMQHYVATRPMFIDVEVMNADIRLVLGDEGSQPSPSNVARGLSSLYKEILGNFSYLIELLCIKISLIFIFYFDALTTVSSFETGLTESLFTAQKDEYIEHEQASLRQLYKAKVEELHAENQQSSESSGTIGRSKGAAIASSQQQISVTVVTEFVHWNEEAISRCTLFSSQPATLAANVKAVFTCLLDEVSQYTTKGLERARDSLTEAAALRERFVLGTSVSKRVAASAAEAAAAAGESSFRSFMVAVQRCASSVAIVQQHFANTISRLLLPVDGAHASSCEEMATAMSSAEGSACKGLQQCIETVMAEVERLLSAEQKAPDYRSPDDGIGPDHRATNACSRVVAYLSRVLEAAFTALEGLNKQAFLTELGNRLQKGLINHWQKFTFNPSGGLRLKRDITEYGEFVRRFNTPSVDEKFELLGIMANVFIVAPESLSSLFEGTPSIRKDAQRFIELREDYKSAKLASRFSSLWPSSS
ncbi:exocyst complex component 5-like [Camellia sinensis]|uniref:exocyst complex component 5-like n=1 Tax=Camellia sinensis TaxID=4442 RepID=UPI0010358EAE|nr:exocyst complex component 5-like [Camellia sinensis]